jgi:hypothetical protein
MGLWYRERSATNTDLTPSWREVHGVVMKMVVGRTLPIAKSQGSMGENNQPLDMSNF